MAFALDEVGFERGATKLALSECNPVILDRYSLGSTHRMTLLIPVLTEAETATLKTLLGENPRAETVGLTGESVVAEWITTPDGSGPVTVKLDPTAADTYTCAFRDGWEITPIIGPYSETDAARLRYYRAEIPLAILS